MLRRLPWGSKDQHAKTQLSLLWLVLGWVFQYAHVFHIHYKVTNNASSAFCVSIDHFRNRKEAIVGLGYSFTNVEVIDNMMKH